MKEKDGWTFGIITDGHHSNRILKIIKSIETQAIKYYEIIIVGEINKNFEEHKNIKLIKFGEEKNWDESKKFEKFPISKKKNIIIEESKYQNLCFLHDYIFLNKNWYLGILKFEQNNNWKILTNKIYNYDGHRAFDWVITRHPLLYNKTTFLPYNYKMMKYQFIPGYYWCAKKDVMREYKLNENLKNKEQEDIEWSERVKKSFEFSFNKYSSVNFLKLKDETYYVKHKRYNKLKLRSFILKTLIFLKII